MDPRHSGGRAPTAAPGHGATAAGARFGSPLVLTLLFGLCLLLSATLLFVVQPMVAKMVLPRLGGSPSVWNTCVVFFQTLLLAGYAYAHLLTNRLTLVAQVGVHVALLAATSLVMPLSIPEAWLPPVDRSPIPWLLSALALYVGPPVLLLAASAPLLQAWFSRTDHPTASDPYFLYAASNVGSILALLLYPTVIEPLWAIPVQSREWTYGFRLLIVFVAAAGMLALVRRVDPVARQTSASDEGSAPVTWGDRAQWLALSAVPSSLLLAVTMYLSTDIAAVPLLWVAPMVLYLLSFVLAFSTRQPIRPELVTKAVPLLMLPTLLTLVIGATWPLQIAIAVNCLTFFLCAWHLHATLARTRPRPARLTEFYLWIAVGGVIGGVFNTLIAPAIFKSVFEYPLTLAIVGLVPAVTSFGTPGWLVTRDLILPGLVAVATTVIATLLPSGSSPLLMALALGTVIMWCFSFSRRPIRFGLALILFVIAAGAAQRQSGRNLLVERTFFGVLRVERERDTGRHLLYHGGILHGEQEWSGQPRSEPSSYYSRSGPIGQLMTFLEPTLRAAEIGVVGLGAGSMAAYAVGAQRWTFYELDPTVERIARDESLFTYLSGCGEQCRVVLGDARLSLQQSAPARYELLVLDAFSSDAIPMHLLTREALQLYRSRLTPSGVIAFHISNNYLDLRPVLAGLGHEAGLTVLTQFYRPASQANGVRPSAWLVMGPAARLEGLARDQRWRPARETANAHPWTDAYSNILDALRLR